MIDEVCSVEGCGAQSCAVRKPEALCWRHYRRKLRTGSATDPLGKVVACAVCGASILASPYSGGVNRCEVCKQKNKLYVDSRCQKRRLARAIAEGDTQYFEQRRKWGRAVYQRNESRRISAPRDSEEIRFRNRVMQDLRGGLLRRPEKCDECRGRPGVGSDGRSLIVAVPVPDIHSPVGVRWVCRRCNLKLRAG